MMRRARPAAAEPAMTEVRDEDLDAAELRRAVAIGVTIWKRRKISRTCYTLSW
jgi:hypothetical protein